MNYPEEFLTALDFVFSVEGGYGNVKGDSGGPTKYGVTHSIYDIYRASKGLKPKNIREITKEEAEEIYYNYYWKPSGADKVKDKKLALAIFDGEIQHGHGDNKKLINRSQNNVNEYMSIRRQHYSTLKNKALFGEGWKYRMDSLEKEIKKYDAKTLNAKVEKNVTIQKESDSMKNKSGSENVQRRDGESRIDYFTRRIRESMEDRAARLRGEKKSSGAEDSAEKSAKPTLKEMMASQKDRLANIKERIFSRSLPLKRMHGDIPEGYQNKYLKDKKIFTKEQIDSMSPKEKKELQDAIKYQSDTIGIPDEKQAKKMSEKSGSGMIYVSGYTRSDGTEVRSYYRSR